MSAGRVTGRTSIWLGVCLFAHLAVVIAIKVHRGTPEDVLWLSHVALGLTGAALLVRSLSLVAAAATCVLVPHALWFADWLAGRLAGVHPLGMTAYLDHADALTWIGTMHHFYLAPLLLLLVYRTRCGVRRAIVTACVLFLVLSFVSRVALPPESNVNAAFVVLPGVNWPIFRAMDAMGTLSYMAMLNGIAAVALFVPGGLIIWGTSRAVVPAFGGRSSSARPPRGPDRSPDAESRPPPPTPPHYSG